MTKRPTQPDKLLAAVYLARKAEGLDAYRQFLASYLRHPAGVDHELIVIYKGFEQAAGLAAARAVFAEVRHVGIEVDDDGFDIGAYLKVARRVDHGYMCFLNTFTSIVADGWLAAMHRHVIEPRVGVVGPMGSYESLYDSVGIINKVQWLCNERGLEYNPMIAYYYDFIVNDHCRVWCAQGDQPGAVVQARGGFMGRIGDAMTRELRRAMLHRRLDKEYRRRFEKLLKPGRRLEEYAAFPPFPNPHIRSNGFMLSRRLLLETQSAEIVTKLDACAFESGSESLTSRLRRKGLGTLIVGRDGGAYDVADWPRSGTFRLGAQESLLIADNQSRQFDAMTPGTRATHIRMTWGDYLGPAPADFPHLGFRFAINRAVTSALAPGSPAGADRRQSSALAATGAN